MGSATASKAIQAEIEAIQQEERQLEPVPEVPEVPRLIYMFDSVCVHWTHVHALLTSRTYVSTTCRLQKTCVLYISPLNTCPRLLEILMHLPGKRRQPLDFSSPQRVSYQRLNNMVMASDTSAEKV